MSEELLNRRVLDLLGAVRQLRQNAVRRMEDKTATVMLDDLSAVENAADRLAQAAIADALADPGIPVYRHPDATDDVLGKGRE